MLTWPSPPMTTCPPLRTIRIVVARHPGERAAVSSVIGALSSIFRQAPDVWARAQPRKSGDPGRLEAAARAFGRLSSIERVDPDRVRPSPPPRAVDDDDAEPFDRRGVPPRPLRSFGELDRRVRQAAPHAAQRGGGAGDKSYGMDRGALDPRFGAGDLDVINARALARIELARLQRVEQRLGAERFGFDHDIPAEGVEIAVVEVRVVAGDRRQSPIVIAELVEQIETLAPIGQNRAGDRK